MKKILITFILLLFSLAGVSFAETYRVNEGNIEAYNGFIDVSQSLCNNNLSNCDSYAQQLNLGLNCNSRISINSSITVTSQMNLAPNCMLSSDTTGTINFIKQPITGDYQVFNGNLNVTGLKSIYAENFGAKGDNSTLSGNAINKALQSVKANNGIVRILPGTYLIETSIIMPQSTTLISFSPAIFPEPNELKNAVLKAHTTLNNSPIVILQNDGITRSSLQEDSSGNQTFQHNTIENIYFHGSNLNNATLAQDGIYGKGVWNVTIKGCSTKGFGGFGIRFIDSNVLKIINNNFYSNIYFESIADSLINDNQIGGGNSRFIPVVWFKGPNSHLNIIQNNFIFNSQNSDTYNSLLSFTSVTSSDIFSLTTPTTFLTERTPVILNTTGTLPGNLDGGKSYLVSIISTTQFKLYTTAINYGTGTSVTATGIGTGTHNLQLGGKANLFVSSDPNTMYSAKSLQFIGNRIDQSYYHGVYFMGVTDILFLDNTVIDSGLNNATDYYGIFLSNASGNNISNNIINGNTHGLVTNQSYGIFSSSTSSLNHIVNNLMKNNTTADYSSYTTGNSFVVNFDGSSTVKFSRIGIGGNSTNGEIELTGTSPVFASSSTNNSSGLRFNLVGTAASNQAFRFQYNSTTILSLPTGTNGSTGKGVCWKSDTLLGYCTAGTWPNCTTCN